MPIPAYITFTVNGKNLKGSVTFPGKEETSEAHEFDHQVRFIDQDWFTGKVNREHSPVVFIKPIDAISITLYQLLSRGDTIDKVHIDWYRHNEKLNIEEIYFQHILEKAKICSIQMFMPHVKDSRYEHYPHLEKISLRYDRIAWMVPRGNIRFTDRWYYAYLLQGMNISEQDEWEKIQEQDAVTDSMDDEDEEQQEELNVTNPRWEHVDEDIKEESPDKASEGDTVKLMADLQGYVEKGKVTFDIYDVSKDTPQRLDSVYGKNEGGTAFAEWPVEDPRKESETHELKLAFEASARSKYSERVDIGYSESLAIQLDIDPNEAESTDDKFTLYSTDEAKTYSQEKTIKDDKVDGDNCVDLKFTNLKPDLSYTLEVDPGEEGEPHYVFEDRTFGEWMEQE